MCQSVVQVVSSIFTSSHQIHGSPSAGGANISSYTAELVFCMFVEASTESLRLLNSSNPNASTVSLAFEEIH
ncbi:hypothetical protein AAG906_029102 [Vitis piasezkii]